MSASPRRHRADLLVLLALALAVRTAMALPQRQPGSMDAAYYYVDAVNLAEGRGFVEDFIWNYLDDPEGVPRPSHLYWMPVGSLLAWLGMAVGGVSFRAAQGAYVVASALLAPIAYAVAVQAAGDAGRARRYGWVAGLLAVFSGFYAVFWTTTDNFTPFALTGSLTFIAAWRGWRTPTRWAWLWWLAAGVLAGLGHLTRADGLLLLITLVVWLALVQILSKNKSFRQNSQPERKTKNLQYLIPNTPYPGSPLSALIFLLLGYLLVTAPWFWRNYQLTGAPLPAAGAQTIWLASYDDLFGYGRELSPAAYFAQGWGPILRSKLSVAWTNLVQVIASLGLIYLAPLAALGWWKLRRHGLFQITGLYGVLLYLAMTVVFTFPGLRGGLFHSGAALLPFVYAAALVGLDAAVEWVAARRAGWNAALAGAVFSGGLVGLALLLTGVIYFQRVLLDDRWNQTDLAYPAIAEWVAGQAPGSVVMIGNPPAYRFHGGGLSVVVPNEPLPVTLEVARRYGVRYLVLDRNSPAPLRDHYSAEPGDPRLVLAATFSDERGRPVYLYEVRP